MKKIILPAALAISIIGAVIIYNDVIEKVNSEIRDEAESISSNVARVSFMHWAYFPDEIFKEFHIKHPGIQIDYTKVDEQYYHDVQQLRIVSGDKLDIAGILRNDYQDFIIRGYLENLSEKPYIEQFDPDARTELRDMTLNRREYAIPYESWIMGVWYNKILFGKYGVDIPRDYKQFIKVCSTFKSNGVTPLLIGARDDWMAAYIYLLRFHELPWQDSSWLQKIKTGQSSWLDSKTKSVFKDVEDVIHLGYVDSKSISLTYHQSFEEFLNGGSAMIIMPNSSISLISPDAERVCEPGVFPLPFNISGDVPGVPGNRADLLIGIFTKSADKEGVDDFLTYLSTTDVAQVFSNTNMIVSPVKGVEAPGIRYRRLWSQLWDMPRVPFTITEMNYDFLLAFHKNAKRLIAKDTNTAAILEEAQSVQDELLKRQY